MKGLKNNGTLLCSPALGPSLLPWDPMAQNNTTKHAHTDGHGNSMTESAQWGRFSEHLSFTEFLVICKGDLLFEGKVEDLPNLEA